MYVPAINGGFSRVVIDLKEMWRLLRTNKIFDGKITCNASLTRNLGVHQWCDRWW